MIEAREDAWTRVVGLEVLGNGQILVTHARARTHTHFFIIETSKEEQTSVINPTYPTAPTAIKSRATLLHSYPSPTLLHLRSVS